MNKHFLALLVASLFFLAGCASPPPPYDWSAFEAANPRSILVVPVVNNTVDVDAPLYALSTLSVPLGEKGYYVFPVHTVKTVLEREGLYEGETVQTMDRANLAAMFGADSVLFVEINRWDAVYALLSTTVTVALKYQLSDRLGQEIWTEEVQMQYTPQQNSSGNPLADLVAAAVNAAMTRAAPNYIPLMNQANSSAFVFGHRALPPGPYAPETQ